MRILFPIGSFYPSQAGGPSNSVYWLAKALTRAGQTVTVVTTDRDIPAPMRDRWADTEAGRVRYVSTRFHHLPMGMMWTALRQVAHADVVHLTSIFHAPSLPIALWSFLKKKKVLWSVRGELDEKALVYSTWKKRPVLWLLRHLASLSVRFHTTSPQETERVHKVLGTKFEVVEIQNFIEIPQICQPDFSERYLLCVGRIHPKKALENLIAALPLSALFLASGCSLKIAGHKDSEYAKRLEAQTTQLNLAERIQFLGNVEGQTKEQLYANALFSVLPSHTENFGNVVIESLAQGTPVIASHGTPWQMLEATQTGFWTKNSPQALAAVIDRALSISPEVYQGYRIHARALAEEHFDVHINIGKWLKVYDSLHEKSC